MSKPFYKAENADRHETLHDDKMRQLDLVAAKFIPPEIGIQDGPTRCYKINKQWAKFLTGMVSWLADMPVWANAEDEGYSAIDEFEQFLTGDDCMLYRLRQKPTDACILQESIDGGETWTDVFDFSACVTIQDKSYQIAIQNQVTNVQETFIDIYNSYTTNYAGLPSDVHPNLAPPAGDDSALKAALCNAIFELVKKACDSAVSYYTESINQQQSEANFLLAVAGFTLTAIALAAAIPSAGSSLVALGAVAPLIAAGIGLGAGLANYLVDFWQQHTIDQFQDTQAMDDVTCYLFECLEVGDVSLEDFRTCLDGTITGANQQTILDFIEILFEHDATYAAFLEKWSNNQEFAEAGINLHCPCVPEFYRNWIWDFSNGLGDFTLVTGTLTGGRIKGVDTGTNYEIEITMPFTASWRARGGKLYQERINSGFHGTGDSGIMVFRATPGTNVGAIASMPQGGFLPSGEIEQCLHWVGAPGYATGVNQIWIHLFGSDIAGAELYLDKVEIQFEFDFAKGGYKTDDGNICA